MPWSYTFDCQTDTVFVQAWGILSDPEVHRGISGLMRDPNFHPSVRVLEDYSRVAGFRLSTTRSTPLHHRHDSKRLRGKHALVLGPVQIDVAQFRSLTSAHSRAFYSRSTALDWLNEGLASDKVISGDRADALLPDPAVRP